MKKHYIEKAVSLPKAEVDRLKKLSVQAAKNYFHKKEKEKEEESKKPRHRDTSRSLGKELINAMKKAVEYIRGKKTGAVTHKIFVKK